MQFFVKTLDGRTITLELELTDTVEQVQVKTKGMEAGYSPSSIVCLFYDGKKLEQIEAMYKAEKRKEGEYDDVGVYVYQAYLPHSSQSILEDLGMKPGKTANIMAGLGREELLKIMRVIRLVTINIYTDKLYM